jgi:hypothetical protein
MELHAPAIGEEEELEGKRGRALWWEAGNKGGSVGAGKMCG